MTNFDNTMPLFAGVGSESAVDHVAVQTAPGMLAVAVMLFEGLGYSIHPTRMASGSWGKAIFMVKKGSLPIQLTDSSNPDPITPSENHFGVTVDDPLLAAFAIQEWASRGDIEVKLESVLGGKYFVTIQAVLTIPIELVPHQPVDSQ